MNRIFSRAALVAAAPLVLAVNSTAAQAQLFSNPPELLHSAKTHAVDAKEAIDNATRPVTAVEINDKTLKSMSESSTVRVACGPGLSSVAALPQTSGLNVVNISRVREVSPLEAAESKLIMLGAFVSSLGSLLLLIGALLSNRKSRFLRGLLMLSLFIAASLQLVTGIIYSIAFPLLALALFDPGSAVKLSAKLRSLTKAAAAGSATALSSGIVSTCACAAQLLRASSDRLAEHGLSAKIVASGLGAIAAALTFVTIAVSIASTPGTTAVRPVASGAEHSIRPVHPLAPHVLLIRPMIR